MATSTAARKEVSLRRRHRSAVNLGARGLSNVQVLVARVLLFVVLIGIWQLAAALEPQFVATPLSVVNQLWTWVRDGTLWTNLAVTLREIAMGFAIAFMIGSLLGWLVAESRWFDVSTRPFVDVANAIPRFGLAPLFVLWFGFGVESKVILVVSVVAFVVMINVQSGIESVDPDFVTLARSLGATKIQIGRTIILPSLAPWLVASLRLGGAYAISAAVVGEFIGASTGIGFLLSYQSNVLNTTGEFTALFVLAIIAAVFTVLTMLVERRVLAWQRVGRERTQQSRINR